MAYPDKILGADEHVVERLHPHWTTLVPATLWFLLLCGVIGLGSAEVTSHVSGTTGLVLLAAVLVVCLLFMVRFVLSPWLRWRTTHYIFTTHRVLIRRGVTTHVGRDIPLGRISDVAFSQSLWDRVVGAGTLTIESPGEHGQETLVNLPRSDRQQQLLNRLIADYRDCGPS